jgi:hypothetical protein
VLQYIQVEIFRASFKFIMGDTLRKKKEGGWVKGIKRLLYCANTYKLYSYSFENCRCPSKMKPCTMTGPEISKKY